MLDHTGIRKIKYRTRKNLGFPEDNWARLGGRFGKKRSYGHFCEHSNRRTCSEIKNNDLRKETIYVC